VGNKTAKWLATSLGLFIALALARSANAGTLKGATGAMVTGALPGQVLWTDYESFVDTEGLVTGDNSADTCICDGIIP